MITHPQPNKAFLNRAQLLQQAEAYTTEWDVIVIGGGATGLGIALEASLRGYKTILLEQADFAKGTSGRSTKLVHGGVRYLSQGNIKLVREATVERGLLHKNAPHLVKNIEFVIPVYDVWNKWKYTIGLKLYDWIAGSLSLGKSYSISRNEMLEKVPGINSKNLTGGVVYHDGQFDDSRLAINLMQTIWDKGGFAFNYMKVNGINKANGKVAGVKATDIETGKSYQIKAKAVVNATGVFVDEILKMDDAANKKTICVSQGVHIVIDKQFYTSSYALMIPKTSDGRVLFAVPWHNKVLLGTTDTPVEQSSLEPKALKKEIDFILETAGNYLKLKPAIKDVLSVFAGLRPLAAPQGEAKKTKEISRSHKIVISPSQLFTIMGGKWTTYRKMGEDMVDVIEKKLNWKHVKSETASQPIHGYLDDVDWNDPFYFYGSDAAGVKQLLNDRNWISPKLNIHKAQVIWAIRYEMARTVEDVLSRRTRALILDAKGSILMAPEVARIMAVEMNKDLKWQQGQIAAYTEVASQYVLE